MKPANVKNIGQSIELLIEWIDESVSSPINQVRFAGSRSGFVACL